MISPFAAISDSRWNEINSFLSATDYSGTPLAPLASDASFRRYIRVGLPGKTAMLMDAPPEKENVKSYLAIARHLTHHGYSAPHIFSENTAQGLILLEDFGNDSFTSLLKSGAGASDYELYESAIDLLATWHNENGTFANRSQLTLPLYDDALLLQETNLFCNWYLPQILGKEKAATLAAEYQKLWRDILRKAALGQNYWVHRDYHADNLMWLPKRQTIQRVGLLDFQDGVYGDAAYDLVSLLEDARRDVPDALAAAMINRYVAATKTDREHFLQSYAVLGAQRNSKIIGIFVRLAARDGKSHYLNFLPRVWNHLERDLAHPMLAPLKNFLEKHAVNNRRDAVTVRHDARDLALTA